jgi:hypothetical protein
MSWRVSWAQFRLPWQWKSYVVAGIENTLWCMLGHGWLVVAISLGDESIRLMSPGPQHQALGTVTWPGPRPQASGLILTSLSHPFSPVVTRQWRESPVLERPWTDQYKSILTARKTAKSRWLTTCVGACFATIFFNTRSPLFLLCLGLVLIDHQALQVEPSACVLLTAQVRLLMPLFIQ